MESCQPIKRLKDKKKIPSVNSFAILCIQLVVRTYLLCPIIALITDTQVSVLEGTDLKDKCRLCKPKNSGASA